MTSGAAYRAAAEALAALAHGVTVDRVDIDGAVLCWPEIRSRCSRGDVLADIAVGLAGIAAIGRYRFGGPITHRDVVVTFSFGPDELADFVTVHTLVAEVDPGDHGDVLFRAWNQALDFVADPAVWRAIERAAEAIERAGSGADVADVIGPP